MTRPRTLKGQLTLLFLVFTLVPTVLVTAILAERLLDAVARWEHPGVQQALDGSFEVARDMLRRAENDLRQRGQLLAAEPALIRPEAGRVSELLATAYNLDFLQIYSPEGSLLFEATRDPLIAPPGALPDVAGAVDSVDPFLERRESGLLAFAGWRGDPGGEQNILVVGNYFGTDFFPRLDALTSAVGYYRQLRYLIRFKQRSLLVSLALGMLVLAALAVGVARRSAARVSRPMDSLGRAMEAVARDPRPVQVPVEGSEELARLIRTFNTMSRELARSREMLTRAERQTAWREAARRVAHEMRNSLTPMTFSLHRARKLSGAMESEAARRWRSSLDTVLEEVDGLKRLAASFSELARLPEPSMKPVDLGLLLTRTVAGVADDGPKIHWDRPAKPILALGDPTLLRQAFTNLLRNAAEATGKDGNVRIHLENTDEGPTLRVGTTVRGGPRGIRNAPWIPTSRPRPRGPGSA